MTDANSDEIRRAVRERYGEIATAGGAGCGGATSSCCGGGDVSTIAESSAVLGYSGDEIGTVPEGADMGLGCGNPQAIASLKPGETVLDLGSGGGFDCFLAAPKVGDTGRVIGVDMTPDMVSKARANAAKAGFTNVEFRLGEIEYLPVADNTIDIIISNCVINLSPEKEQVFKEAFRILKPGGRLAIWDTVATAELPEEVRKDLDLYTGCMAGASLVEELETMLRAAGFTDIKITPKEESRAFIRDWAPGKRIEDVVVSATIEAKKP